MTDDEAGAVLSMFEATIASIDEVLGSIPADGWALPTDCPGWTVSDVVAHIIGLESIFLGRPQPEVEVTEWPHVATEAGAFLEVWVEAARPRDAEVVLDEFHAVTAEALARYHSFDDATWAAETMTPTGPGTNTEMIALRLFDVWVHEQDIRRAVGRAASLDSPAGRWNVRRCSLPLAMVAAKRAEAPNGAVVQWRAHGPPFDHLWTVEVRDGRGHVTNGVESPTVEIISDLVTFVRLGCGRVDPDAALAARIVTARGDIDLGRQVVRSMAFTP